ncbi:hypothetical protein KSP40_PGU018049 [Platanthera guangdongensis]|uniref:Uncharacterized protein n=1 Tax=Platanthera guangdongensis TaxID=2320717 RepID=A0ABR2MKC1_9ASPA
MEPTVRERKNYKSGGMRGKIRETDEEEGCGLKSSNCNSAKVYLLDICPRMVFPYSFCYIFAEVSEQKKKRMKTDSDIPRFPNASTLRNQLEYWGSLKGEQVII